ncbi:hypothetical protein FB451DRAFT_139288 [Mycena latifolia]|nr:hypothetical protein FB451DRAFT_139288 [Mycena latifolia]
MSFISNADHFTLGDGVYNNIHGNLNIVHNAFYGRKRHREEIGDAPDLLSIMEPMHKRRREEGPEDGIKVIRNKHLKLSLEIASGHGYSLHAGENKGRAVILKVFNAGPTVREQLESTVALSKGLLHPNVLRIEGVSSPASSTHFIAYENAYWKTAEGPLAAALRDDLTRSITLGFKMIAGLSSGMNHLSLQGISLACLGAENFDIFLDVNDRFLININPRMPAATEAADDGRSDDNITKSWDVFNALCQKVLRSANRALHTDDIERDPVPLDFTRRLSIPQKQKRSASLSSTDFSDSPASGNPTDGELLVPPRREYVWRTIDRGQQSLATVATRIASDINMEPPAVNKLALSDRRSPHRCAGYVREEIMLAPTMNDSAVVSHDAPSALEICSVCHEIVDVQEEFRCICGDPKPGWRSTVKCQECKIWSHSDCVGNTKDFTCQSCSIGMQQEPPLLLPLEEEDEVLLAANATDQEIIDYKRLRNVQAARRSRKRKLMYQQELEETLKRLTREKEIWKARALDLSRSGGEINWEGDPEGWQPKDITAPPASWAASSTSSGTDPEISTSRTSTRDTVILPFFSTDPETSTSRTSIRDPVIPPLFSTDPETLTRDPIIPLFFSTDPETSTSRTSTRDSVTSSPYPHQLHHHTHHHSHRRFVPK